MLVSKKQMESIIAACVFSLTPDIDLQNENEFDKNILKFIRKIMKKEYDNHKIDLSKYLSICNNCPKEDEQLLEKILKYIKLNKYDIE